VEGGWIIGSTYVLYMQDIEALIETGQMITQIMYKILNYGHPNSHENGWGLRGGGGGYSMKI